MMEQEAKSSQAMKPQKLHKENSDSFGATGKNPTKRGAMTKEQRLDKVRKYLEKKRKIRTKQQIRYECRKVTANKRLRVKGRFMTKQQALETLGLTHDQLLANEDIQRLLTEHADNQINLDSMYQADDSKNGHNTVHKICNLQVLLENHHLQQSNK